MSLKTCGGAFGITAIGLVLTFLYGGPAGLAVAAILTVLEISISFDNAVINATVLGWMNEKWQRLFLTAGVIIAVFGMRLLFPFLIVCVIAKLSPVQAYQLAMDGGSVHTPGTYAYVLHEARPAIAAFGRVFLLMLFLKFIFDEREFTWLSWLERPLAKIGKLDQLSVVVAGGALVLTANCLAPAGQPISVMVSGALGLIVYILVNGLGELFEANDVNEVEKHPPGSHGGAAPVQAAVKRNATGRLVKVAGRAAFYLFLYLEVLDATFSFDGAIGAFAVTSDPVIIGIGLGIGGMYIRSLTVFLVRKGTLSEYVYLEHGAQWAIGALAVLLLSTIKYEVPEVVTGLVGVGFIGAALASSLVRKRRKPEDSHEVNELEAKPIGVWPAFRTATRRAKPLWESITANVSPRRPRPALRCRCLRSA